MAIHGVPPARMFRTTAGRGPHTAPRGAVYRAQVSHRPLRCPEGAKVNSRGQALGTEGRGERTPAPPRQSRRLRVNRRPRGAQPCPAPTASHIAPRSRAPHLKPHTARYLGPFRTATRFHNEARGRAAHPGCHDADNRPSTNPLRVSHFAERSGPAGALAISFPRFRIAGELSSKTMGSSVGGDCGGCPRCSVQFDL